VRALARPGDRIVLCEKVPEIAARLRENAAGDRRIKVHLRDGYEAHSLLPPPARRGLVLVDSVAGRGTTFTVYLPAARRKEEAA